ncbi:hypothetical protein HBI56_053610 [Parastagonospora nodorum]|nr:hypothetical protein HBH52_086320 [Parastagonospora nodorum]KAH4002906.1 hypothetical protein HBI10_066600 [Parastagonospora nodorum]KAH4028167.1 hypothetical protein HBI13_051400 [Parastagonospora nodorum]KAH4093447.1 hypothetical protein HBH46_178210 [Parastagonospora nodorum]KAH4209697.1 hypothetical protein HBI95_079500 [Parastagonospora nodorum]
MRVQNLILLGFQGLALGNPLPQGTGNGADSCPSDPLNKATWTKAKVDAFLVEAAKNYTKTDVNNIQSLTDSWGAPNFFCGIDKFCNAGNPCLPITLPAWYAALAIQNWNNYMNNLNTAVSFASSIISLKLGEIVADLMPAPVDDATPQRTIFQIMTAIIGVVPFAGPLGTLQGTATNGLGFLVGRSIPPVAGDKFLAWSNAASSMAEVARAFQSAINTATEKIINTPVDDPNDGILSVIKDGAFIGVAQNFTQAQMQDLVIESLTQTAIGKALQAQKYFILRTSNIDDGKCKTNDRKNQMCTQNTNDKKWVSRTLLRREGDRTTDGETAAGVLMDKYKMSQEYFLKGPTDCFDGNNKKQLQDPIELVGALPSNPTAPCVFNLIVCDVDAWADPFGQTSIAEACKSVIS